jgi:hypothetical protein
MAFVDWIGAFSNDEGQCGTVLVLHGQTIHDTKHYLITANGEQKHAEVKSLAVRDKHRGRILAKSATTVHVRWECN